MIDKGLTIRLVGSPDDHDLVRFDDFTTLCQIVSKCLRRVDEAVRPEGRRLYYRIIDMRFASAAVTLEPICPPGNAGHGRAVLRVFRDTVSRLQRGKLPDKRLTFDDLEAFRDLMRPLQRHTREVWVNGSRLTDEYSANIERILGSAIPSKGQVSGRLERLNVHERYEFVLFPVAGSRIVCKFDDSMLERVRKGIKRSVTVSGTLFFQPDKAFPDRVTVEEIEIHPPNGELPALKDLKGIARRCTGNMSAVAFVRSIRDA
ncbi:MAG: hypothetical protein ABR915_12935 [Thermoguttaceae bacterium]|jgi:hypothetical protein